MFLTRKKRDHLLALESLRPLFYVFFKKEDIKNVLFSSFFRHFLVLGAKEGYYFISWQNWRFRNLKKHNKKIFLAYIRGIFWNLKKRLFEIKQCFFHFMIIITAGIFTRFHFTFLTKNDENYCKLRVRPNYILDVFTAKHFLKTHHDALL